MHQGPAYGDAKNRSQGLDVMCSTLTRRTASLGPASYEPRHMSDVLALIDRQQRLPVVSHERSPVDILVRYTDTTRKYRLLCRSMTSLSITCFPTDLNIDVALTACRPWIHARRHSGVYRHSHKSNCRSMHGRISEGQSTPISSDQITDRISRTYDACLLAHPICFLCFSSLCDRHEIMHFDLRKRGVVGGLVLSLT